MSHINKVGQETTSNTDTNAGEKCTNMETRADGDRKWQDLVLYQDGVWEWVGGSSYKAFYCS